MSSHGSFSCTTILVVVTTMTACRAADRPRLDAPRDLILVTIDTLRADRVGVEGGPHDVTPTLDELGRQGAVFLDATAHAPLTVPSHASILTGRYPTVHGVHDNAGFMLSDRVPTLAVMLHDAGYRTAAFVSSFVVTICVIPFAAAQLVVASFTASARPRPRCSRAVPVRPRRR